MEYEIITALSSLDVLRLRLLWNDELFMPTKWCSAIKRAESTLVSHVTLMACLRSIHHSFSLSVYLSAVWLCRAFGWTAAPCPGCPQSRGACGHATQPHRNHLQPRHRLHSVYGLRHLAPGHLQRRKRNRNCLLPHHCHRWVPQLIPVVSTYIIPIIPTSKTHSGSDSQHESEMCFWGRG